MNLPESVFLKPAAAAVSSIYHTLRSSSNTSFKSTRSPTLSALLICVVAARYVTATLSQRRNAELLYVSEIMQGLTLLLENT